MTPGFYMNASILQIKTETKLCHGMKSPVVNITKRCLKR
jgi:hypothetical protein